jgi:hypothetical protein
MAEDQSGDLVDPITGSRSAPSASPRYIPHPAMEAIVADRLAQSAQTAVDHALEAVPPAAKAELAGLSERTKADLRLQLLQGLKQEERNMWASSWQCGLRRTLGRDSSPPRGGWSRRPSHRTAGDLLRREHDLACAGSCSDHAGLVAGSDLPERRGCGHRLVSVAWVSRRGAW